MQNAGKIFENAIKSSFPDYCVVIRLADPPQSFGQSEGLRFSNKNPCDYVVFDSLHRKFLTLELKSTKSSSFSIQRTKEEKSKMIKLHQIKALTEFAEYDHVIAGFIFNIRDEKNAVERTYFQYIGDFNTMVTNLNKASCNEKDIITYNAIEIHGEKKRTRYTWSIDEFLNNITEE